MQVLCKQLPAQGKFELLFGTFWKFLKNIFYQQLFEPTFAKPPDTEDRLYQTGEIVCMCLPLVSTPWTARRSNQSNLKEISPEYSLERLMLKLKLQYLAT